MFLIDEAYIEFSLYESCKDLVVDYKNIIISRTFSKAFGLAGFRIGYIIGNPVILEFIGRIRNPKAVTTLTQIAAMTALDDVDYMYRYVDMVLKAKRYFETELFLLKIDYKIGGGNFVLIKIPQTKSFIKYMRERDVYVRDYTHIDKLNGFDCRVTVGTLEQMMVVVNFIKEYLNAKTCNI